MSTTTTELPPTPPFALGNVAQELYTATAPLTYDEAALGFPWAAYVAALGLLIEDEMTLTGGDGDYEPWTALADPQRCPATWLGVLAQWAGLRSRSAYSEADLRSVIGPHAPGLWRGTRAALIDAVQRHLTVGGTLYFEERAGGDPYALNIFSYNYDTADETAIRRELQMTVPAGLLLDYEVRQGQPYGAIKQTGYSYVQLRAQYVTYGDMLPGLPQGHQDYSAVTGGTYAQTAAQHTDYAKLLFP